MNGSISGVPQTAPSAIQRLMTSFSASVIFGRPFGIAPDSICSQSRLSCGLPGSIGSPLSPPALAAFSVARLSPPLRIDPP